MTESILASLVQILALLARTRINADYIIEKNLIISFLQMQYTQKVVEKYTALFQDYYETYDFSELKNLDFKESIINEIELVTARIFVSLSFKQRIFILTSLFEFNKYLRNYTEPGKAIEPFFDYVKKIADNLNISDAVYKNCKCFCLDDYHLISDARELLIISGKELNYIRKIKNLVIENLSGLIYVLKFEQDFFIIKYKGDKTLYVDGKLLKSDTINFFAISSSIYDKYNHHIYYNDINKAFFNLDSWDSLIYSVDNIDFKYPKSQNGIHPFSFECESNELIGIIGSSGCGKTTLLNLLNGSLAPKAGKITLNGYRLTQAFLTEGYLGNVPQDDLLIEELTVFENLYYSAKLCKKWSSKTLLKERVKDVLEDLQIYDTKDLKVGSIMDKKISGGQRKRLNIALEIIRDPSLFFIDEPTSGLSSTDSYHIIYLLKQQALRQKILFINIHQPSNEIFYLFDKIIVLDKGGYPIYYGHPGSALEYFRKATKKIETLAEGKYQTEQEEILSIIEETYVDEFGGKTKKRLLNPKDWYEKFKEHMQHEETDKKTHSELPPNVAIVPGSLDQFNTYFMRNLRSKVSDRQYLLMALTISPLLAFVLSFLCRQNNWGVYQSTNYLFIQNENISAFYFMSVIVAMFVGLIISAEEVYRDRKLYIRERYLKLKRTSYFSSKLLFLIGLSLVQTLTYAIISTLILGLSANFLIYWITIFLISIAGNVLGLLISSMFNSLVAIYIAIPLILVPQILLSGVVVPFKNLNPIVTSQEYVPFIGNLMPTRWSYEALIINQYKNNPFQSKLFQIEMEESNLSYNVYFLFPEIKNMLNEAESFKDKNDLKKFKTHIQIIYNELSKFPSFSQNFPLNSIINNFSPRQKNELFNFVQEEINMLTLQLNSIQLKKDSVLRDNKELYYNKEFKNSNYNREISELVLQRNNIDAYKVLDDNILRFFEPIYKIPENKFGRSHFYSWFKRIGGLMINTLLYNNFIISLMIMMGFTLLIFEVPTKIRNRLKKNSREDNKD